MIPLGAVLILAAGCFLAGWMARAGNGGEHAGQPYYSAPRCAPPYDWAEEGDL